jgi:Pretoxin HINT domain
VEAKDLHPGDRVVLSDGNTMRLVSSSEKYVEDVAVYNFEVEDTHSYFVGEDGVWVHNYEITLTSNGLYGYGVKVTDRDSLIGNARNEFFEDFTALEHLDKTKMEEQAISIYNEVYGGEYMTKAIFGQETGFQGMN